MFFQCSQHKQFYSGIIYNTQFEPHRKHTHLHYQYKAVNPLNAELNPICHLLALLGGATIVVVSRLRVNVQSLIQVPTVREEITKFSTNHRDKLFTHSNELTSNLLNEQGPARLKRFKPLDLPTRFT